MIPDIAETISCIAAGYQCAKWQGSSDLVKYCSGVIDRMCRHLEYFVRPRVSVAAQQRALELGINSSASSDALGGSGPPDERSQEKNISL